MQVKIEELAEKFQEFYLELEGDVRVEIEKEKGEASEEEHGFRAKEVVELVEGTLSTLFYDRCVNIVEELVFCSSADIA
jgi:hypothetical protein